MILIIFYHNNRNSNSTLSFHVYYKTTRDKQCKGGKVGFIQCVRCFSLFAADSLSSEHSVRSNRVVGRLCPPPPVFREVESFAAPRDPSYGVTVLLACL